ncbi:MAG: DUF2085 domain-containing protein [Ignavibacteria bacterium]|nr:DUF2085 domain-containing protein [Ignavibacteria bacterium]
MLVDQTTFLTPKVSARLANPRVAYVVIASGTAAWCAALFLAPIIAASSGPFVPVGTIFYQFFHGICHQIDGRSFHVFGQPVAVCSRCSAIYLAFLAGTILYPTVRRIGQKASPARTVLVISVLPMLLDVFAGFLGVHEITNLTRSITGAIFGAVLPFFVIPIATEAFSQLLFSPQQEANAHFQRDLPNV